MIAREVELSLQFAKEGKKEKALLCLKKKRFQVPFQRHVLSTRDFTSQERLLQQAEKSLANVEELTDTLGHSFPTQQHTQEAYQTEFTVVQKDVFDGLKAGSRTLKQLQEQVFY